MTGGAAVAASSIRLCLLRSECLLESDTTTGGGGDTRDCEVAVLPDPVAVDAIGHDNGTEDAKPVAVLSGLGSNPAVTMILFISAGTSSGVTVATFGGIPVSAGQAELGAVLISMATEVVLPNVGVPAAGPKIGVVDGDVNLAVCVSAHALAAVDCEVNAPAADDCEVIKPARPVLPRGGDSDCEVTAPPWLTASIGGTD